MTPLQRSLFDQRSPKVNFNPEMLILAREVSGLTQSELAKELGVNQNQVSRWEAGLRVPNDDDIEGMASVLDRSVGFFCRSERIYSHDFTLLFHRARARAKISVLKKLHARLNVLRIGLVSLCRQFKTWDVKVPLLRIEDHESAAEIAKKVRQVWQVVDGPIRNLVSLLEATGSIVLYMDFETDDVDAIGIRPLESVPIFFINSRSPADRIRFNLAHELGHIVMHEFSTETMEEEAHQFAAEFLVPSHFAKKELAGINSSNIWELKMRWRVSAQCLIKRASDCGIITESRNTSLMAYFSKMGWRKGEPCPIPPEEPQFAKSLVNTCLNQIELTREDLLEITGFSESELDTIFPSPETGKLKLLKRSLRRLPR